MKRVIPLTFRATKEAWLGQLLLPYIFFSILTLTVIRASDLEPRVGGFGMLVITVVAALDYLLPMLRNWVRTDSQRIEGLLNGRYLYIYWGDVLAAWMVQRKRQHYLCLGTKEATLVISLRFLDHQAIWEQICRLVPQAALGLDALHRIPEYQAWIAEREATLTDSQPHTAVDHWLIQLFAWAGLMFFSLVGLMQVGAGQWVLAAALFLLAAANGLFLLNWGLSAFSNQGIERNLLFGGRVIAWKDVRWIEIDPFNTVLVLVSDEGRLVIPGPRLWCGSGKKAALEMLLAQAEQRRIPVRRTLTAWLNVSRRTGARR